MNAQSFKKDPVWSPTEKSGGRMKIFMKVIEDKYKIQFKDYWDFHKWTVENISQFWAEVWDFSGIIYSKSYDEVIDLSIPMEEAPKWFEGARLNLAENLLKFRDDRTALIAAGEDREIERISFKEMFQETRIYAAALRKMGLQIGDRVACYMSNRTEAVIAMLAVVSVGAIWTGATPTLGANAYLNRVKQAQPKFLFTIDQFQHNKKRIYLLENIKQIAEKMLSLEKVIIVPAKEESKQTSISNIRNSCFLDDFKKMAYEADKSLPELVFEQVSFSHPVFINFTSGTTGAPKMIVHGFGGLLTSYRDSGLHWNSPKNDVLLTMTAVGWASWNRIFYLLFMGTALVLFEGLPYLLSPTYVWDLVDELKLTTLLIIPADLDGIVDRNYVPSKKHNLSSLKTILTGGSIVKPRNYFFVVNKIKKDLFFAVGYGSTEIIGSCIVTDETLPMYPGEISSPSLGVALACLDNKGNSVLGEMGECTILKPMPSMPICLWNDTKGEIYKKAYFSTFPGKCTIGDSIIINPLTKGSIICGRSDETLQKDGVRFGSSEIYSVEIKDCLCVGQYSKEMDERIVLFIEMKEGMPFTVDLVRRLRKCIESELTVYHVPDVILQAPGIPYNTNGKKTEIIVKKIINRMPHNTDSIVISECLEFYYNIPDLKDF